MSKSETPYAARTVVYEAIDSEREYQDLKWPEGTGCKRTIGEELLCAQVELAKAQAAWNEGSDDEANARLKMLDGVRKVAAVLIRCMENHGAPHRNLTLAKIQARLPA